MALFGFGKNRPESEARRRVETWARDVLQQASQAGEAPGIVKANEIVCADPACPGVETVILILDAGRKTRAFKLAKPLSAVTRDDVARVLGDGEPAAPDG